MCVYILDNYSCKVAPLESGMGKKLKTWKLVQYGKFERSHFDKQKFASSTDISPKFQSKSTCSEKP